MNLSTFQATLARHPDAHLTILLPGGDRVPAHFHITEAGRTKKHFVDCGGKIRRTAFASLQVWVADDIDHRLPAGKLATILEKAAELLGKDDPQIQVECQEDTIGLFSLESIEPRSGTLILTLAAKQTACLAMDVCLPESSASESCCGGSSCCS